MPSVRLLTVREASVYLSATIWFVRSLIWNKQIPHLRLGKRLVIDRADLDAFIDNEKTSTVVDLNIIRPRNHESASDARTR